MLIFSGVHHRYNRMAGIGWVVAAKLALFGGNAAHTVVEYRIGPGVSMAYSLTRGGRARRQAIELRGLRARYRELPNQHP